MEVVIQSEEFVLPIDVTLDLDAGKMYWSLGAPDSRILRANLDGSNVEDAVIGGGLQAPSGLALDLTTPPPPIPTVSQWGLTVMVMLLLIGATTIFARRKSPLLENDASAEKIGMRR